MTTLDLTRGSRSGRLFPATVLATVATLFGQISAWNDARMTRNALSRLTDRELDDIGLSRADIDNLR